VTAPDWLAVRFEEHRDRLRSVAVRILGSPADAEDAVQEAWLRLSRTDADGVDNLGGWLTTVVGRIALDMLRSRAVRRELPEDAAPEGFVEDGAGPEHEAEIADSVGAALLVVLDTLSPAERLAFVLHDTFAVPFEEIGAVLDRSPQAAKQLAHRARQKVQGHDRTGEADPARRRAVVDAFLAASRSGDFAGLVALLHPGIRLRADATAVRMGSPEEVLGAESVAAVFSGRALAARPALVGGAIGIVWLVEGRPKVAWAFTVRDGRVQSIEMIADRARLEDLQIGLLD